MTSDSTQGEWRARDKETYSSALTKILINLSVEAKDDGIGEHYEDAVLDVWADIPTCEKHKKFPKDAIGTIVYPGIEIANGDTSMTLFKKSLETFPPDLTGDPQQDAKNARARVLVIKQLCVDMLDRMEILRGRHRLSSAAQATPDMEGLVE